MRTLGGFVTLLLVLAAACRPVPQPSRLSIGATLPLTSVDATLAASWRRGYERAVAEVNRAGGVLLQATSRRVQVVLEIADDKGELDTAEREAQRLAAMGVRALLATPGVIRMAAQSAIAQRNAIPYVVPADAGPELKASARPWVLVSPDTAATDEEAAYHTALAALAAVGRAASLDSEAIRRAFGIPAAETTNPRPEGGAAQAPAGGLR
ncbi:MAG: ABC transporter substrate-binding protein [Vicinamibacterales bacterium]